MNRVNYIMNSISERIIKSLENNVIPWRKSWQSGVPRNLITNRAYRGVNYINLCFNDYPHPFYLTYLQCKELGGSVLKGEKGQWIIYWKLLEIEEGDKTKIVPFMKVSTVFNLAQTTLHKDYSQTTEPIDMCESIIEKIPEAPIIKHNYSRCYYNPSEDKISLPPMEMLESKGEYYSALFHELAHWTGHKTRLNRLNDEYNKVEEELTAEIASSYLCAYAGIDNRTLGNQLAYINDWLKSINNDKQLLRQAIKKATKAVEYLLFSKE